MMAAQSRRRFLLCWSRCNQRAPSILVIDMLERGLNAATQEALIADLRRRGPNARQLFFLTRSSAILDLYGVGADEAIILCPANHSPPSRVIPYPGVSRYAAVATCLASPEVRAHRRSLCAAAKLMMVTSGRAVARSRDQSKPGGGTKPTISFSMNLLNAIAVLS